jgi:hypothetical protein
MQSNIVQALTNEDWMPGADMVQDFYETEGIAPSLEGQWEPIPEHQLADENIPGYPDICPYQAWHVETFKGLWVVYHWYEGPGTNDEAWLYCKQ